MVDCHVFHFDTKYNVLVVVFADGFCAYFGSVDEDLLSIPPLLATRSSARAGSACSCQRTYSTVPRTYTTTVLEEHTVQ